MNRELTILASGVGVLAALLLLIVTSTGGVLAGAPGQTEIPLQCRPGWYNPPYEHCPPRPSASPTPTASPTTRPTPVVVGITPAPLDIWVLPDTSTE